MLILGQFAISDSFLSETIRRLQIRTDGPHPIWLVVPYKKLLHISTRYRVLCLRELDRFERKNIIKLSKAFYLTWGNKVVCYTLAYISTLV